MQGTKIGVGHELTIVLSAYLRGNNSHKIKRLCFIVETNQYICWASVYNVNMLCCYALSRSQC